MFYEDKSRIGSRRIGVSRFVLICRTGVWRYLPSDKHKKKRFHAVFLDADRIWRKVHQTQLNKNVKYGNSIRFSPRKID